MPWDTKVQNRINARIRRQTDSYLKHVSGVLYRQAVKDYKTAQEMGYPFHAYEAVLKYEVTYNRSCHLSALRDRYEYLGGAHGSTIRLSDTWSLASGRTLPLSHFFGAGVDYQKFLIEQIIKQADRNIKQNPGIYFENYRELIAENFDPQSYYLTPEGLAIYYQQYDIAPYSTGIVVFTIPYDTLTWRPRCSEA